MHAQELAAKEIDHSRTLQHEQHLLETQHGKDIAELNAEHQKLVDELRMTMEKARIDAELRASNDKAAIEK